MCGYIGLTAGPVHWRGIRDMAARLGLHLEESRGWLQRSFVLRGDDAALRAAAEHIQDFVDRRTVGQTLSVKEE